MDKLLKAGVKVVQRDGHPWGVLQVQEMGDQVMLILCSEHGMTIAQQMRKGDTTISPRSASYERLKPNGPHRQRGSAKRSVSSMFASFLTGVSWCCPSDTRDDEASR
jgi:hypothetical protein